jgi:MFS family permease
MDESRVSRWAVWTGPVFAVLFFVLSALTGSTPSDKASPEKVDSYVDGHKGQMLVSVFLSPLGVALLLIFAAYVYSRARAAGDATVGPRVLVAGAVLWASGLLIGSMVALAQVSAADHNQLQVGQTLNVLASASWVPFIGGIAVFLIGAGITGLSSGMLPTWIGWVALVLGIVSLAGPGGFIGFFAAPLWMLVAGILLAMRTGAPRPSGHRVAVA